MAHTFLSVLVIVGGFTLNPTGKSTVGALLITGNAISLMGLFIYGKERQQAELRQEPSNTTIDPDAEVY